MTSNPTNNMAPEEVVRFVEGIKQQWVTAIDALLDPLMFVDKDFKIKKANKAFAAKANISIKEVSGKTCYKLLASRDTACPGCTMQTALKSGKPESFELDDVIENHFYEVTSQPTRDQDGNVDGCVQVYRDRTESKMLQKQLAMQDKLASIGLLAGGVAHEINNPLGGILIFSQMLLKEMDKESVHYQDVVEIELATQRCKAIVDSLLDFARQQPRNKNSKNKPTVHLCDAVKSAVEFANVGLSTSSGIIEINEKYTSKAIFSKGDRNKLVQVFLNLMQNSIHSMPSGGRIAVDVISKTKGKSKVGIITVTDTGDGIDPKDLPKIFDPFFTTKDPGEGTGLGLALCFSIVTEAGGTMKAVSKLDEGTTFTVELPLCNENAE